jgi:hypothetical protein
MPHAAVIQVRIEPDSDVGHRHGILHEFVVPQAKALAGFQRGEWMNDGNGTGLCIVVFDTKEHAKAALAPLMPATGPAVISSAVHEVEVEVET